MRAAENRWQQVLPIEKDASILDWALSATGVGVYEYDVATGHQRFSEACKAIWGLGPDEDPIAARIEALIHPEDRDLALHKARESLRPEGAGDFQFEHRIIRPTGEVRWIQIRGRTEFESNSAPRRAVRSVGVMLDVTAQKAAYEAQQRNQQQVSIALRSAGAGIWSWDAQTNEVSGSAEQYALFGMDPSRVVSLTDWTSALHPDDRVRMQQFAEALKTSPQDCQTEFRILTPAGERWLLAVGQVERDAHGNAVRYVGMNLDITERKNYEDRFERNAATFRSLIEESPFGIYVVDAELRIRHVSREAHRAFANVPNVVGRDLADALGVLWSDAIVEEFTTRFRQTLVTGEPFVSTRTVEERADLHIVEAYDWRLERITMPDGRFGIVCYYYDLTELKQTEEALHRANERLTLVQKAAQIGAWDWNITSGELLWSDQCKALFGFPASQTMSHELFLNSIVPEERERIDAAVRSALTSGDRYDVEIPVIHPDGSRHWVASIGEAFFDADHQPRRMSGMALDITERKRSEAAIAAREAEWRTLVDAIPTLAWMAHADGWIFWYNQRWFEYTGTTLDQMQGWGWEIVHDPKELPLVKERWQSSIDLGQPFEMTFPLKGADGVFRPFLTRIVPLKNDQGEVSRWFGTNTDVSPERHLHEQLQASEARLKALFETVPVGIVIAEAPAGRIVEGNRQVEDILGHPVKFSPTVDRYSEWVSHHEDGRQVEAHEYPLARALAGEQRSELEVCYQRGDGRPAWVRFIAAPICSEGRITGGIVATLDIDREKRALQALDRIRAELEARVQQEVCARESAQATLAHAQRMEALGQLAGGIAHDFNNVLQAIAGGLSLVQKRAQYPEDVQRFARMARDAAARGASVTARLLAFARKGELKAVPVAARSLLENLREILSSTLGTGITIRVDVDSNAPPLLADKAQLETVMVNLAVNARDAMPRGGTLTLSAHPEELSEQDTGRAGLKAGRYLRLALSDSGTGMDPATLARASEPFFTTKKPGEGTGLGLAMARGFAQQSGGGLSIDSTLGKGTTVTLWFPQASAMGDEDSPTPDDAPTRPSASSAVILVADDDQMVREILVREFEEFGYSILEASDGLSALEYLDKGAKVDLLITDLSMPGMNGLVLAEEARRRHAKLPVLLLTGYADANVRSDVESMQDESFILLRKPVSADELAHYAAVLLGAETTSTSRNAR